MNIEKRPCEVSTREGLVSFLNALAQDFEENKEKWENRSIYEFLKGCAGFAGDLRGYFENSGDETDPESPSWRIFAEILRAGRVYE